MEMVPLDDLLPEILAYAPNCADPMAQRFLREAARDLCTAGRMWREADEIVLSTPAAEGICTIPDASIIAIEQAELAGYALDPKTVGWLDVNVPDWSIRTTDGDPARYVTQLTPNTVTVVPRATGRLKVRLVLQPSRGAMMIPAWMVEQYGTELGKGAAGRILVLPDPAVSNLQLGAALVGEFKSLLNGMKLAAARGQQGAPLRTRPHFF